MILSVNKVRKSSQQLLLLVKEDEGGGASFLQQFLNLKEYNGKDISTLLRFLSSKILDEAYTVPIAHVFGEYLLPIITEAVGDCENVDDFVSYQRKCVALGKLVHLSVEVKRYAVSFFRNKPPPFAVPEIGEGTEVKKIKNVSHCAPSSLAIVKCCYQLLRSDTVFFKELWDWSEFVGQHLRTSNKQSLEQLYGNHIVAIITNMSTTQLCEMNARMTSELLLQFAEEQLPPAILNVAPVQESDPTPDKLITINWDLNSVTNIEGVFLPIFNKKNFEFYSSTDGLYEEFIKVDSTKANLRSIALGIAAGKAICLSGPVGCGKTTLVQYLARMTGRICPKAKEVEEQLWDKSPIKKKQKRVSTSNPNRVVGSKRKNDTFSLESFRKPLTADSVGETTANGNGFLRIQLGDQTDCKMLLGQYHCTDVPGEFIWLPGVLTQAVMNGYWLLLEDLDTATQDTYTILSSLLENNYLNVPGFRDCVKVAPGFQLFVTIRTKKSSTNCSQKALYSLLEKNLYTINILPLSRNELCKVVSSSYAKLASIANRIVDVFLTFSSGDHSVADNLRQQELCDKADTTENYLELPCDAASLASVPNSGRLISTRDLIKLCKRSNPAFLVTSTECAYFVFQNAVDIFCSYLPDGKEKIKLITSIGAKLGIIQSRCEFYGSEFRPEVSVDNERLKVGRAELYARTSNENHSFDNEHYGQHVPKRQKN